MNHGWLVRAPSRRCSQCLALTRALTIPGHLRHLPEVDERRNHWGRQKQWSTGFTEPGKNGVPTPGKDKSLMLGRAQIEWSFWPRWLGDQGELHKARRMALCKDESRMGLRKHHTCAHYLLASEVCPLELVLQFNYFSILVRTNPFWTLIIPMK